MIKIERKKVFPLLGGGFILAGLFITSQYNFLLFHSLAELFSIVVAFAIFMLAWNARRYMENDFLVLIAIGFAAAGFLDLLHTLAYKGMNIFEINHADPSIQLWISGRYIQAATLVAAPVFLGRKLNVGLIIAVYIIAIFLVVGMTFYWQTFPVCFIEGQGLTPFKKISEYIICLILIFAMILLFQKRRLIHKIVLNLMIWSMALTILSELAFTFYVSVYGFSNLAGHFLKIIAFYLVYRAIVVTGFTKPYDLLFRELKQSKNSFKENEQYLNIVLDSIQDGIFVLDLNFNIIRMNKAMEKLNPEIDSLKGKKCHQIIRNSSTPCNVCPPRLCLETKKTQMHEIFMAGPDGETRTLEVYTFPMKDDEGNIQGMVEYLHDISIARQSEEKLIQAKKIAETASRIQSNFLAGMSHELRTPLNAIIGFSELLSTKSIGDLNQKQSKYMDNILSSGRHLADLIDNILTISMLGGETSAQNMFVLDLKNLMKKSLDLISAKAANLGISLELQVEEKILNHGVTLEKKKIEQVLSHLADNALKFTPSGGKITLAAKLVKQNNVQGRKKSSILVSVTDSGLGVKPEDQKMIFQDFFQVRGGLSGKTPGTGLGLSLSRRIIELSNGKIWVESKGEGKGSRFAFTIPI